MTRDQVAEAIDACLRSDDPPARVVVGADAEAFAALARDTNADDFARLLRAFVADLARSADVQ